MRTRLVALARRVATSDRLAGALPVLAVPHVTTPLGVNPVIGEYYGMLLGRRFASDDDAARHYFRHGWRLGVIPTPLLERPAARFSAAAALATRNELARVARGMQPRDRLLGAPSRLVRESDLLAAVGSRGGWLASLTRTVRRDPAAVDLATGGSGTGWSRFLAGCAELIDAARVVHESRLVDLEFYEGQIGGARPLSRSAALDDYVANGERDGRTPHPFFEAEWYAVNDRTQVRRGRPINQFLDFVSRGESGQAGPHFWGVRYAEQLTPGASVPSLLGHFTVHAHPDAQTPASEHVAAVPRRVAERVARERVGEYVVHQHLLDAHGPILRRHPAASSTTPAGDETCLVVVDASALDADDAVEALASSVAMQSVAGLRVVIVERDGVARNPNLAALVQQTAAMDFVPRPPGATVGDVARRVVAEAKPDAWTVWSPQQSWAPEFLAVAVAALRSVPDAAAAAVVHPGLGQQWLRTDDATWLRDLDDAGVVVRASGNHGRLPSPKLDLGLLADARIALTRSAARCAVVHEALAHAIGVDPHRRAALNAARQQNLIAWDRTAQSGVGIVIPTYEDWAMTWNAVRSVLTTTDDDATVVIVDNGSRRPVSSVLAGAFAGSARVQVMRMARNTDFALGSNVGAARAARDRTVFLNNDTAPLEGWLPPLLSGLDDPGVCGTQPLLMYGDRTVQTAGTIFLGGMSMPRHLLAEAHVLDVPLHIEDYPFSALTAACLAVRWDDLSRVQGFDPHYVNGMEDVDLCLRLGEATGGSFRVRLASQVVHYESRTAGRHDRQWANRAWFAERWRRELVADLDDRELFASGPNALATVRWLRSPMSSLWEPVPILEPRARVGSDGTRLRWAIKTSATGDVAGDAWGDTAFADALAGALRRLGQDVVIDRSTSHARATSDWDDVTLTLRGLKAFVPQPRAVNLLWVISHPDLITRSELESGFDRVYSAGDLWAREVRRAWGIDVRTLLQATDTGLFHPDAADGAEREGVLFVGRTRGVSRPIVADAIAADADVRVYGDDGWEQFIPPRYVRGSGIRNRDVPAAYARAGVVLNDHWSDMAAQGFFSNRLFDAVATGARVVSDPVPGMSEIFGDQVRTYGSIDELRLLLGDDAGWPDPAAAAANAARIAAEHSFDVRARALLDDVLAVRREKGDA